MDAYDRYSFFRVDPPKEKLPPLRDIEGYGIYYGVTNDGRIWSYKVAKWLTPQMRHDGYFHIALCKKSKTTFYGVHRLVALAYIERLSGKPYVNHKNGIRSDNRVENLEWCTPSENTQHSYKRRGYPQKHI